jgi:hypothetical protein
MSASTSGPVSMPPVSDTPSPVAARLRGGEGVEKAMGPPSPSPHIHLLRCVRLCRIHVNTPTHCLIHVPLPSIADGDEGDEGKATRGSTRMDVERRRRAPLLLSGPRLRRLDCARRPLRSGYESARRSCTTDARPGTRVGPYEWEIAPTQARRSRRAGGRERKDGLPSVILVWVS